MEPGLRVEPGRSKAKMKGEDVYSDALKLRVNSWPGVVRGQSLTGVWEDVVSKGEVCRMAMICAGRRTRWEILSYALDLLYRDS
jgi:accessory colonization factor AcfC